MTSTLWTPSNSGLHGYDVDVSFSSLPLSMSVNDDDLWPSTDVCSLTSVDVVQLPQLSTFHTFKMSTSSPWSSQSTRQHDLLDDQHVTTSKTDETSWSTTSADTQTSEVVERCWFNSNELMSNDDLDKCLSHLLMTSQHGCHGNDNKVATDWQSEPSDVRLLADQRQPSLYDGDRLCLVTTTSPSDEKHLLNASQTTEVRSSALSNDAVNSDHGELDHFSTGFLLLMQ